MEFAIPIINPATGRSSRTFELRGKVDGLAQLKQTGELFILEHKSAAQITGDYIERLPSDFQINLYAMALSRFLKRKISGVSSINSFALTLEKLLYGVRNIIERIDSHDEMDVDEPNIEDIEVESEEFDPFFIGSKVKVLIQDVDRRRCLEECTGEMLKA